MNEKINSLNTFFFSICTLNALPNCPLDQSLRYDNCYGTYTYSDGSEYFGEWKDGERQGQGTSLTPWKQIRRGMERRSRDMVKALSLGLMEVNTMETNTSGHGKTTKKWTRHYHWAHGDKYVGAWKDNKMNGQGTLTWADGDKYVGAWKDGKRMDSNSHFRCNGRQIRRSWKDDKNMVKALTLMPMEKKRRGYYMNDEYVPDICEDMGLSKGTSGFEQCVLKLIDKL